MLGWVQQTCTGHWDQKKRPLKRGVRLWEVENVGFICGLDQKKC